MALREREVKDYFLKMIKSIGAITRKIKYENRNGCPDWMVIHMGKIYLVELKATRGKLTMIQRLEHERVLHDGMFEIDVVDSYEAVDVFIEEIR